MKVGGSDAMPQAERKHPVEKSTVEEWTLIVKEAPEGQLNSSKPHNAPERQEKMKVEMTAPAVVQV
jgi:hypothetical protein